MKKKIVKKLGLSKETLRDLTGNDMRQAVGGATYACGPDYYSYFCPSVRVACKETPY